VNLAKQMCAAGRTFAQAFTPSSPAPSPHPHVPRHAGAARWVVDGNQTLPLLHSTRELSGDAQTLHLHLRAGMRVRGCA
jgi:hypothetical protein